MRDGPAAPAPRSTGRCFPGGASNGRGSLAGGLDPWNVGEAIRLSGAPMVDVSSGVERGAGLKDPALIEAFLAAVRRA